MYLDATEHARLLVFNAAQLARRNLADGLRLSATEATAVVADEMHRAARRGGDHDAVVAAGRRALRPDQVLDGVNGIVDEIRIEVLLEEGTRLVVLRNPLGPAREPAIRHPEGDLTLNAGLPVLRLRVRNESDRPVRISSHYPFWKATPGLAFDREAALGHRLDLPAGESLRWEAGEERSVALIPFAPGGHDR